MTGIQAFLVALQMMESGGDYQVVNSLNYLGAYQFGEAALTDLGYVNYDGDAFDNDYSGGWTGKDGVHSAGDFLRSRNAQDRAAEQWVELLWTYAEMHGIDGYAWTEVGGIRLTPAAMVSAMHLMGPQSLSTFIATDGRVDTRDPYGTPITRYMARFGGYDVGVGPQPPVG